MQSVIRILLADDHELVRKGICNLIELRKEFQVVAEAANGNDVLHYLQDHVADLILLDIEMPLMNGIETLTRIKQQWNSLPVMMLTMQNKPELLRQCIAFGASGYIHKSATPEELHQAIDAAMHHQPYFSKEAMRMISAETIQPVVENKPGVLQQLSSRELEILKLIAQGYSSTVIGSKLFLSPQTIDTHRKNILKKLNLHSVRDLTKFAIKYGIIE